MKVLRSFALLALLQALPFSLAQQSDIAGRALAAVDATRQLAKACEHRVVLARANETIAVVQSAFGPDSRDLAFVLSDLAQSALFAGDLERADTLARRAVDIGQRTLPTDSLAGALMRARLGSVLIERGELAEARTLADDIESLIAAASKAPVAEAEEGLAFAWRLALEERRLDVAAGLARDRVALATKLKSRFTEAQARLDLASTLLFRRNRAEAEVEIALAKTLEDSAHPALTLARLLTNADLAVAQSDLSGALALLSQAETVAASVGRCGLDMPGNIWKRRGDIHQLRRAPADAADAYSRALAAYAAVGLDNAGRLAVVRFGLASSYARGGQFDRADPLFDAATRDYETTYGSRSVQLAQLLAERSLLLDGVAGRAAEEESLARRSLDLLADRAEANFERANALMAEGLAERAQGRRDGAKLAIQQALVSLESVSGPKSLDLAPGLVILGELALESGDASEAQRFLQRALDIQTETGWTGALGVARTMSLISRAQASQGRLTEALAVSQKAVETLSDRLLMGASDATSKGIAEVRQSRRVGENDIALLFESLKQPGFTDDRAAAERFLLDCQIILRTSTGAVIAQTSARFAQRNDAIGKIIADRQKLVEKIQALEAMLARGMGDRTLAMKPEERRVAIDELLASKSAILAVDNRLRTADSRVGRLMADAPVKLDQVKAGLAEGEVLVQLLLAEHASYALFVTRDKTRIVKSRFTGSQMEEAIGDLRRSLDPSLQKPGQPEPFNVDASYFIYRELFAPAEDMLANVKAIALVPDGGFQNLPISILLTSPPQDPLSHEYGKWPWLMRRHAIALQSSVSSWVALREASRTTSGALPFLGIGDPLLSGGASDTRGVDGDKISWGGRADTGILRQLGRLQETSNELSELSSVFGGKSEDVYLRERAREGLIKSSVRPLRDYKIIAFATHGIAPGELGIGEAGLVLTPPDGAGDAIDDGLLTASEIALLDLNAEWVILSACRTASGNDLQGSEGLSGLARSFFLAGARSVLVSHWSIESRSAALFTSQMAANVAKGGSKSAALRQAQLALTSTPAFSHPFYWAAYSVVSAD